MRIWILAATLAVTTASARAAPVELVQAFLPGVDRGPVAAAAEQAGVAFLDHTPAVAPPPVIGDVAVAIEAYDALRLDDAWAALERAGAAVDATGAALPTAQLAELFVYRALVRGQRGDAAGAWDEWIAAATVAPARVLDPGRFPPQAIAEHERARAAVAAQPTVAVAITGGDGCAVTLDGAAVGAVATATVGVHWLRALCPGAAPWVTRATWTQPRATVAIAATRAEPPSDDALLVTARGSGVGSFIAVDARGALARVRRFAATGAVEAERTVALAAGPAAIAAAVAALLTRPSTAPTRWYRSRWLWAAGAAGLAAAIAVPVTIWAVGDQRASGATIVGPGGAL